MRLTSQHSVQLVLAGMASGAWFYMYHHAEGGGGTASLPSIQGVSRFALVYGMWAIMTAAMMVPAAWPVLNVFARSSRRLGANPGVELALFASAYLTLWLAFSIGPAFLQWQLIDGSNLSFRRQAVAPAVLAFAGLYQFTSFKQSCLRRCKTPFGFVLNEWRHGPLGALKMGFMHGLNCIGCCWAEMLVALAVGAMNLAAMIILTALICAEKFMHLKARRSAEIIGVFLLSWSAYYLLAENRVV